MHTMNDTCTATVQVRSTSYRTGTASASKGCGVKTEKLSQNCDKHISVVRVVLEMPFAGAWEKIQISTQLTPQIPQTMCFFIRYSSFQYTCIILCFYV